MVPKLKKTVVINVVALTKDYISEEDTPNLWNWSQRGSWVGSISPPFPAVTCVSQATYLTGVDPCEHGVTGNGFYDSELKQIFNWHQSAGVVRAERVYTKVKRLDPTATVFVHTWWHSMYDEDIDYYVTVRPEYCSNGKKFPDSYTKPASIREVIHKHYGVYPLHRFWGPMTSIQSSVWIADTAKHVDAMYDPTLSMIYLPHLDYSLQKFGPNKDAAHVKKDLQEIDQVIGNLIAYFETRGAEVIILSEYGIAPVQRAVDVNRELRKAGYIAVRKERGGETLDCGASLAFAAVDHQIAHVHVKNMADIDAVRAILESIDGVDKVLTKEEMKETYHPGRCGDLVCIADANSWFTYYFWGDDKDAPDYARCVAIHDKPGYDPTEMFLRFSNPLPILGILYLFLKVILSLVIGIRTLVDATPLDRANDIRGSHGRSPPPDSKYLPILIYNPQSTQTHTNNALTDPKSIQSLILEIMQRDDHRKN